ncbi:MAG: ATP-binding protein [Phycisphaerales bacterium]
MNADPHLKVEMLSQPRYLAGARAMIASVAQRLGFPEGDCGQIALALDEALCNVINHGYQRDPNGRIWISVWPMNDTSEGVRILIEDEGRKVDPEQIRARDLDEIRPGGLGVYIINRIMDRVEYRQRPEKGMSLLMEKRRCCSDESPDEVKES